MKALARRARVIPVLITLSVLFGCLEDRGFVLRNTVTAEGAYLITVSPSAEGQLFTDKTTSDAYKTVTIWVKPGKIPQVKRDDGAGSQLITNGGVSPDPIIKTKLGVNVAQVYSFVMPDSDVTIVLPASPPGENEVFVKSVVIMSVPLYTADAPEVFLNDGSPGPSIRDVSAVTQNSNGKIKIQIEKGDGVSLSYKTGGGEEVPLNGGASFEVNAPALNGQISVSLKAEIGGKTRTYPYRIYNRDPPPSDDALLNSLVISGLTLNFNSLQFEYDLISQPRDNSVEFVSVTPVLNHSDSELSIDGLSAISGSAVQYNLIKTGLDADRANVLKIKVTPATGPAGAQTYTVKIYRRLSDDANLSDLTVSGAALEQEFNAGTTLYDNISDALPYSTGFVTLCAAASNVNAVMALSTGADEEPFQMLPGVDYAVPLPLCGASGNTAVITVTAQDGTVKAYTVKIYRELAAQSSPGAKLSGITVTTGGGETIALSPEFAENTFVYMNLEKLPVEAESVVVYATAASGCTVTVDGGAVSVDGASGETVSLANFGENANVITLLVTAADGGEALYLLKIYRGTSG
ncbi:MAG: cadherin-like beta sandwich domain-containing protein [Spirochaetaceae bacterium]|jgi:hypothetical protein|nr:cadherin-like beta sandwich domain-containing protein [Spirochaetaceae bacterium]